MHQSKRRFFPHTSPSLACSLALSLSFLLLVGVGPAWSSSCLSLYTILVRHIDRFLSRRVHESGAGRAAAALGTREETQDVAALFICAGVNAFIYRLLQREREREKKNTINCSIYIYMSDAVFICYVGLAHLKFGECKIAFHVLNLTYVKGCFHNAAGLLDMEADVRRSKLLLCGKVMGIAFNGGIATHSPSIVLTCRRLVGSSSSTTSSRSSSSRSSRSSSSSSSGRSRSSSR